MKLSEIRATLQEIRVSPVKTLGQNFLHDQNLARWIVDQADITPDDYVVEIGPGLGSLTLHAQLHHHVQYLRAIPPTVFFPGPDVDSAVVRVLPRDPLELPARDDELLAKLIRDGFSQRRKQLQKFLRAHVTNWDHAASTLGFDPKARAEELSLLQWIGLANYIVPP